MSQRTQRLVRQLRRTTADPTQAYVLRTRLRRTILACIQSIMEEERQPVPNIPMKLDRKAIHSSHHQEVAMLCNNLLAASSALCQPSEPLIDRWELTWSDLDADLRRLEILLSDNPQ